ncbi:hypothetical protein RRG08_049301 [Elysia crispata]|uniref:Uncharacterized protein n=1 Tax=Elysia crispata TaxID=231223 RepID=A0AAE1B0B9_9GAST|nr:hypothetical protein RRG08_049301 [Elysia crispata]
MNRPSLYDYNEAVTSKWNVSATYRRCWTGGQNSPRADNPNLATSRVLSGDTPRLDGCLTSAHQEIVGFDWAVEKTNTITGNKIFQGAPGHDAGMSSFARGLCSPKAGEERRCVEGRPPWLLKINHSHLAGPPTRAIFFAPFLKTFRVTRYFLLECLTPHTCGATEENYKKPGTSGVTTGAHRFRNDAPQLTKAVNSLSIIFGPVILNKEVYLPGTVDLGLISPGLGSTTGEMPAKTHKLAQKMSFLAARLWSWPRLITGQFYPPEKVPRHCEVGAPAITVLHGG